jgi:hypothetical protein
VASPYLPAPFATPIVNPALGSVGAPPLPYISNSEFIFAPTALPGRALARTPANSPQTMADTIRRASGWADQIMFGVDPSGKGASLAASLSVEDSYVRVKGGELRLICDYKPIIELVGLTLGSGPGHVFPLPTTIQTTVHIARRTIIVPFFGVVWRTNDAPVWLPSNAMSGGRVYAVWSYVNGYAHTMLMTNVAAGATSCKVMTTNGTGGVWGVYAASTSGHFPGTQLTVTDGVNTESVYVKAVTQTGTVTKLTTSAFQNSHTVPAAPDFIPVSAIPSDVHQAVISLTSTLIKLRGTIAFEMPTSAALTPPQQTKMAQAGTLEDWEVAVRLLKKYAVHAKSKV